LKALKGLKGTVHPKMTILSSFTHPRVVLNLYEVSFISGEHKINMVVIAIHSMGGKKPWKSMGTVNSWLPTCWYSLVTNIFQKTFCVQKKKETHTGLE